MTPPDPRDPRELLGIVARRVGPTGDPFVFLGGAACSLYMTDSAAVAPRATKDVDAVVRCETYAQYHDIGESLLKPRGFVPDSEPGAPICRWLLQPERIRVDLMPTHPKALGLQGKWLRAAHDHAILVPVGRGQQVRLASAPCFIATKLDAFLDRGDGDFYGSHDLEDVIAVIDGRSELIDEVAAALADVRAYLRETIGQLLDHPGFRSALPGHLPGDEASQARVGLIRERLERLAGRSS